MVPRLELLAALFFEHSTSHLEDAGPWEDLAIAQRSWIHAVQHGYTAPPNFINSDLEILMDKTLMLSTGAIGRRLGVTMQSAFIEEVLGIPHSDKEKAAFLWTEDQFTAEIGPALIKHIEIILAGGATPELSSTRKPRTTKADKAPKTSKKTTVVSQGPVEAVEEDIFAEPAADDNLFAEEEDLFAE